MKIEIKDGDVLVNGVDILDLTEEAQDNLRKRMASYMRTHRPEYSLDFVRAVKGVVFCYGGYDGDDIVMKL